MEALILIGMMLGFVLALVLSLVWRDLKLSQKTVAYKPTKLSRMAGGLSEERLKPQELGTSDT